MKYKPKISIIIPVYGVEQYIAKCLSSIKNQTFTNYEAIIVDDGSPDDSIPIAKKLVGNDPRFIFLEKENGGQGSARNMGLDHAKGEYISFIDSDDYVEPDFLKLLYTKITTEQADVCLCNLNYVDIEQNHIKSFINDVDQYYQQDDFLLCKYHISTFMCDKLFKTSVFLNMRFDESVRTYEDAHFTFRLLYKKKLTLLHRALYNYVQRPGSTSHDLKPSYIDDRIAVKNSHISFTKKIDRYNKKYYPYINYCYLKTFVFFVSVTLARYSTNYYKDIKKLSTEIDPNIFTWKNIFPLVKEEPKTGLSLLLFKISPTIFRYFVKFWFRNAAA